MKYAKLFVTTHDRTTEKENPGMYRAMQASTARPRERPPPRTRLPPQRYKGEVSDGTCR